MKPVKPFMDHPDLLDKLSEYGLHVGDRQMAGVVLRKIGYHRLSGYRYLFRRMLPPEEQDPPSRTFRAERHIPGSTLDHIVDLVAFDARLRQVVLVGTEDFEIRVRTCLAHVLARRSPLAHVERNHLRADLNNRKFEGFRKKVEDATATAARANDDFVVHHRQIYRKELPVWAIVEHLSFGNLPFLYDLMKNEDRDEAAKSFGVQASSRFGAWLRSIADLRNYAAHGVRLFNKPLKRAIKIQPNDASGHELDFARRVLAALPANHLDRKKIYPVAAVLAHMLKSHESGSGWPGEFSALVKTMPSIMLPGHTRSLVSPEKNMGFPRDWALDPLWS